MAIFKTHKVYVRVFVNRIYVRNTATGKSLERKANEPFSTDRLLIGSFLEAEVLLRNILKEMFPIRLFLPTYKMVVQPMELSEGGISEVERRTLIDLCEQAGAQRIEIYELMDELSDLEILAMLNK